MIKFFRRIRKKLLSEGRFVQYLAYALGEIVLVVIGILIALQVNNWNNEESERKVEITYLEALKTEFTANLAVLDQTMARNELLVSQLSELLTLFESERRQATPSATIAKTIGSALSYEVFYDPSTGVLTDIISSGNLKQLKNAELRQKIASFGNTLEKIRRQEINAIETRANLGQFITEKISLRPIFEILGNQVDGDSNVEAVDFNLLFTSMKVENDLIMYQGISQTTNIAYYAPLKQDIEEILTIIDNELND